MILSTFVAVSAEEQEFVPGNAVTIVDVTKDFDAADAEMLNGANMSSAAVTTFDDRTVYGGACDGSGTSYFGFIIKNTDGGAFNALGVGDVVTLKADIYTTTEFKAGSNAIKGSIQGILLRAGNGWAPAGDWMQVAPQNTVFAANEWTTVERTFTVTDAVAGNNVCFMVRPNVACDIYLDNLELTVKGGREILVDVNKTMDSEATGLLKGSDISSVTYADGIATAIFNGTGNNAMVGAQVVAVDTGAAYSIKTGDVVEWEIRLRPSAEFKTGALNNGTKGILFRTSATFPPSGDWSQIGNNYVAKANEWTVFSGAWAANKDLTTPFICVRPEAKMTIEIDYIKIKVQKAAEMREDGWAPADMSVPASVSSSFGWMDVLDGGYRVNATEVAANIAASAQSSSSFVKIIPVTPIAKADLANYKLLIDVSGDNVRNSVGGLYASNFVMNARVLDNTTSVSNGRSLGYVLRSDVSVNNATPVTVEYDLADMVANGATSTATEAQMITIQMNMQYAAAQSAEYGEGYVDITNARLVKKGTALDYSAAVVDNKVQLTVENATDKDYKFAGRFLVAEYNGDELVQFGIADDISVLVEAGADEVVEVELKNAPTGTVKVFVWEPGSIASFIDLSL